MSIDDADGGERSAAEELAAPSELRALRALRASLQRSEALLRFVADAGATLAPSASAAPAIAPSVALEDALVRVARLAAERLGAYVTIDLVLPDGSYRHAAVAHVDPRRAEALRESAQRRLVAKQTPPWGVPSLSPGPMSSPPSAIPIGVSVPILVGPVMNPELAVGAPFPLGTLLAGTSAPMRAMRTGRAQIVNDVAAARAARARDAEHLRALREIEITSLVAAPLVIKDRVIGVITIASDDAGSAIGATSGLHFGPSDLACAEDLARHVAAAIDRARLAADADAAKRSRDEFLSVVSHELRTPLTAVLGWTRMLRTTALEPVARERALEVIERNGRALATLVEDLLDISRVACGQLDLETREVEALSIVDAAVSAVSAAAAVKGIAISTVFDPDAGTVAADAPRLVRAIGNVLSNAVKFTPSGGHIDVRCERVRDRVDITIADDGRGIAADFLPHVFERFRQGDATRRSSNGGLGIGLAIARELIELHGGVIRANSEGEGRGATFSVRLPALAGRFQSSEWPPRDEGNPVPSPPARVAKVTEEAAPVRQTA